MLKCLFCCQMAAHASKEQVMALLLSDEHRPLLEGYRAILAEDPDYLRFHSASISLRLMCVLRLHDIPSLRIDQCGDAPSQGCCIVEAMLAAVQQLALPGSTPEGTPELVATAPFALPQREGLAHRDGGARILS